MSDKEKIQALAASLGEALCNTDEFKELMCAKKLFAADSVLNEQIEEFRVQKALLEIEEEKEDKDEHVVDILNSRCNTLYDSIMSSPVMIRLQEAEKVFSEFAAAVNLTIDSYINDVQSEGASSGCSPSKCASCKACK